MRPLANLFQEAGLGHLRTGRVVLGFAAVDLGIGFVVARITGISALGTAWFFLFAALALEAVVLVANARHQALVEVLPELCESLASAISSGSNIHSALRDLKEVGPKTLKRSLMIVAQLLDRGIPTSDALRWLKVELSDVNSDQLIELLQSSLQNGGFGLVANLSRLAAQIRLESSLMGELLAKQGWVLGTAKLAIATPWALVWLLSRQPGNAAAYNSASGIVVLSTGLAVCLFAYLLILNFGALPKRRRVFA